MQDELLQNSLQVHTERILLRWVLVLLLVGGMGMICDAKRKLAYGVMKEKKFVPFHSLKYVRIIFLISLWVSYAACRNCWQNMDHLFLL